MRKLLRRSICFLLTMTLLLGTSGCTQRKTENEEKLKIKVEFDDSTSIFTYIIELRNIFPEYEFEFQSMVRRGHIDRVESRALAEVILSQASVHEDVADIVISDAFRDELPNLTGAFAEVSGESYTSQFQTSYLNDISMDGKLYYLPFFIGLKGIIYNQTMFAEQGWAVPKTYDEFLELLTVAFDSGIPPISVRTLNDFGAGLFSTSYLINDGSTMAGHTWQEEFTRANPAAVPETFTETLTYLKMLSEIGHIADVPELIAMPVAYLMKERQVAMCIANGETLSQVYNSGTHDRFAMMPLYSKAFPDGVIIEHNTLYLGVSAKAAADPERAEALDKILNYIYSEEGQLRLMETGRGLVSPCYGLMEGLVSASLSEFKRVLEGGNLVREIAPFAIDKSFDDAVMEFLVEPVTEKSEEALLQALNQTRELWLTAEKQKKEIVTHVTETFSRQQLLNLILQAMQIQTDSDASIAPALTQPDYYGHHHEAQLARSKLYNGDLTAPMIESSLLTDFEVKIYRMTGKQLLDMIDYNKTNNCCYGIIPELTYSDERKTYFTTGAAFVNGEPVDPGEEYTVCAPGNISVTNSGYLSVIDYGRSIAETLIAYCKAQGSVSPFDLPEPDYIK